MIQIRQATTKAPGNTTETHHSPQSLDVAPSDFFLFTNQKNQLLECHFSDDQNFFTELETCFRAQMEDLQANRKERKRWEKYILQDDYST